MSGVRCQRTGNKRARYFCLLSSVFCLLLAACGFSPIYMSHGSNEPVAKALNNVEIASIPDRQGQMLRNHLIDRMYTSGRPAHPVATLEVKLRSTETDVGTQKDATTVRRELSLWADYVLKSPGGEELAKSTAHSVVGFSKLDEQYGTVAAERNAYERAINEVGEQIVNRVSLYYAEKP
jgi:LPS-assembly lipoprotein